MKLAGFSGFGLFRGFSWCVHSNTEKRANSPDFMWWYLRVGTIYLQVFWAYIIAHILKIILIFIYKSIGLILLSGRADSRSVFSGNLDKFCLIWNATTEMKTYQKLFLSSRAPNFCLDLYFSIIFFGTTYIWICSLWKCKKKMVRLEMSMSRSV